MQELADGNLGVAIETRYPGSVMGDVRNTVQRLSSIISEVRSAGEALSQSAEHLLATSSENSRQNELQSAETDQMATAINEMAASVNQVTVNANDAASATRSADEEIISVNQQVQQTSFAIQNLAEALEEAGQVVEAVSTESGHIEKIVGVIRGVAEQTNLLALNAAIEAARAGEHGRGFAVVADEVRSLATRTQNATQEISSMIVKLQAGSGQATEVMQSSRNMAQETVAEMQKSEEALARVRDAVSSIADMNIQIATASDEQSRVTEEVNSNIMRINTATDATSEGAVKIATYSRELAELSVQLIGKVKFFKS